MGTFERIAQLPLEVDGYRLSPLSAETSSETTRVCTLVTFTGGGLEGVGEDVVYSAEAHTAFQQAGIKGNVNGSWTLSEFCAQIEGLDLLLDEPGEETFRLYRIWALQSAALDLALRQNGQSLHAALDRHPRPMTYVTSLRLGEPPTIEPMLTRLKLDPTLRFKLDATSSWTPELIAELVETGAVNSIDFKGLYHGTVVDQQPDALLYRRVAAAFPDAWLEDPNLSTPEASEALADAHARITWDVPIHSIEDIEALPFAPQMVNVKPSRIGTLPKLLATYDYCDAYGIGMYSGGQTELGPGRGQAQYLAAIFHPDTPNDLAPSGYNLPQPPAGLPPSPLVADFSDPGFRWPGD
jgi:L-alanine-DL-glutamate epimerase-like enolase superfamily enzyme